MARAAMVAIAVCLILSPAVIHVACSHPAQYDSQGDASLLFTVAVETRPYVVGEAISIRLILINPTSSELRLGLVSEPWIDYEILSGGAVLYRWSDDKIFPAWVWELTMAPQEMKQVRFVHTGTDYPLSAGVYQVRGIVARHAEAYAPLMILDILPGLVFRAFSVLLAIELVAILIFALGYTLARRPSSKKNWGLTCKGGNETAEGLTGSPSQGQQWEAQAGPPPPRTASHPGGGG